jgi:hypothetical protein
VAHDKTDGLTAALLQQEVQNEFQEGNTSPLPPEVQNLMRSSKEVLAWPSHYQCSWLIQILTPRARSEWHQAEETEWYTSEQQGMYTWLGISAGTNS